MRERKEGRQKLRRDATVGACGREPQHARSSLVNGADHQPRQLILGYDREVIALLDQPLHFLRRCFENQVNKLFGVSFIGKQDRSKASKQTGSILHPQAIRALLGGLGHFFTTFLTLNHLAVSIGYGDTVLRDQFPNLGMLRSRSRSSSAGRRRCLPRRTRPAAHLDGLRVRRPSRRSRPCRSRTRPTPGPPPPRRRRPGRSSSPASGPPRRDII